MRCVTGKQTATSHLKTQAPSSLVPHGWNDVNCRSRLN